MINHVETLINLRSRGNGDVVDNFACCVLAAIDRARTAANRRFAEPFRGP